MTGHPVLHRALVDRRRSVAWWSGSLVAVLGLVVVSFGAIDGEQALEDSFADLPESVKVLLGVDGALTLTSPAGYLNSQLFANFLPLLLTVFAVGHAARLVAGDEADGHLELLLAHPVRRSRVVVERGVALAGLLVALGAVCGLTLVVLAPLVGLDVGVAAMTAATATSVLLALVHGAVTFGVGAATGSRAQAIAAGAGLAGGGFLLQSLATLSDALAPLRWLSPWQWFLADPAIVEGWSAVAVPGLAALVVSVAVVAVGVARFTVRDVGHG